MGDLFWPTIYPGIIVGLLYGLSLGGRDNAVIGGLGGLAGSAIAYAIVQAVQIGGGILPLATMIGLGLLGAFLATWLAARLRRS